MLAFPVLPLLLAPLAPPPCPPPTQDAPRQPVHTPASAAAELLPRVADPQAEDHEEALRAWEALPFDARLTVLREGLHSGNPRVSLHAARHLDWHYLSLHEIRRQAAILAAHPEVEALHGRASLGSPEYPRLLRSVAERGIGAFASVAFGYLHRIRLPEHLADVLELYPAADAATRRELLWEIHSQADMTDLERPAVARVLLHALEERRAREEGREPPAWADVQPRMEGPGLPPAFRRIAAASWGIEDPGGPPDLPWTVEAFGTGAPRMWVLRWMREVVPAAADVPFLIRAARHEHPRLGRGANQRWALRWLGRLATEEALAVLRELAAAGDLDAAGALALRGEGERFEALLARAPLEEGPPAALWELDRPRARKLWLEAVLAKGRLHYPEDPRTRLFEHVRGYRLDDDDLEWAAERLLERAPEDPLPAAAFFSGWHPEGLTAGRATILSRALATATFAGAEERLGHFDQVLGLLEVRAPEALVALLKAWARSKDERTRRDSLERLAMLGNGDLVDDILAAWAQPPERFVFIDDRSAATMGVGRIPGARVERFLREQVGGPDGADALAALAVRGGLPERCAEMFAMAWDRCWDEEPYATARARILAGDPVGAALALLDRGEEGKGIGEEEAAWWLVPLGLSGDPRVEALHRRLRADRAAGFYWKATAGLALSGDPDARAELLGLLRDDRIGTMDCDLGDSLILNLNADEELVLHWLSRVASNCCLWFYAETALGCFAWSPVASGTWNFGDDRRRATEWFERHRGRFVWSRILEAWVPR